MARMPDTLPAGGVPRRRGVRLPGDAGAGDALAVAAAGVEAYAERVRQARDQGDRLTLINATTALRAAETERLVSEGDQLAEDALDGFSARFGEGFDARAGETRARLPPRLQGQFDALAQETRADFTLKAADVERTRRVTRNTRLLDDQLDASARTVATDASAFAPTLEAARAAIAAADLPEPVKEARLARLPNTLARERFVGLMQTDPDAVEAELSAPEWAGLFTPDQALALRQDARAMKKRLEAAALDAIEPAANEAINRIIGQPAHFAAEIAALRDNPALARAPAAVAQDVIRRVAARGVEARLQAVGEVNPWAAKQELLSGQHDSYIDAGDKGRLLSAFNNDIEARARAAAAEARAARLERAAIEGDELKGVMESALASRLETGRAPPVDRARIAAVFGEDRARAFETQLNEAGSLYAQTRIVQRLPANEIAAHVATFAPKPGAATYAADARFHAALTKAAQDELAARVADPAGVALRRPEVARALEIFEATGAEDARARYVAATRRAQTAMGVDPARQRVVPAAAVTGAAARLKSAPPDRRSAEAVAVVEGLKEAWGSAAGEAIARVAAEADAPELFALAPIAHRPEAARVAAALTAAAPGKTLTAAQRRTVSAEVGDRLKPLMASLDALPGGTARAANVRAAAERLALADADAGRDPKQAAVAAAQVFLADVQIEDGVRLPRRWRGAPLDADAVLMGADALRERLLADDALVLPAGDGRLEGEARRRAVATAARAETRWIAANDDRGLILWDARLNAAVKDREGRAVRADFDALLEEAANSDPGGLVVAPLGVIPLPGAPRRPRPAPKERR